MYNAKQLSEIKQKIIRKITSEVDRANEDGLIEEILERYGIVYEETSISVNTRLMKILVFGSLAGKKKDFQGVLNKLGINLSNVEFINDYSELKRYSVDTLRFSTKYSDLLIGPIPHSQTGMGDNSSLIATIKSNPAEYPRVQLLEANNKLKITKTNFEKAIISTRYFDALDEY